MEIEVLILQIVTFLDEMTSRSSYVAWKYTATKPRLEVRVHTRAAVPVRFNTFNITFEAISSIHARIQGPVKRAKRPFATQVSVSSFATCRPNDLSALHSKSGETLTISADKWNAESSRPWG